MEINEKEFSKFIFDKEIVPEIEKIKRLKGSKEYFTEIEDAFCLCVIVLEGAIRGINMSNSCEKTDENYDKISLDLSRQYFIDYFCNEEDSFKDKLNSLLNM